MADIERDVQALTVADPDLRKAAADRLARGGDPEGYTALIHALEHSLIDVRINAAEALGAARIPQAVPLLVKSLAADPVAAVRQCVARSLGRIGGEHPSEGVEALAGLLDALQDADRNVVRAAAKALGEIGDTRVVPNVIRLMKQPEPVIRQVCALALGDLKSTDALPVLVQALHDESWMVRQAAAQALAGLGDRAATPALIEALEDANRSVRVAAEDALKRLNTLPLADETGEQ